MPNGPIVVVDCRRRVCVCVCERRRERMAHDR